MVISVINFKKTDFSSVEKEIGKMERYYQKEIETASREQILAWQNERLVKQVRHVWDNVPYYRKRWRRRELRLRTFRARKTYINCLF